jgi:hypothetical protein
MKSKRWEGFIAILGLIGFFCLFVGMPRRHYNPQLMWLVWIGLVLVAPLAVLIFSTRKQTEAILSGRQTQPESYAHWERHEVNLRQVKMASRQQNVLKRIRGPYGLVNDKEMVFTNEITVSVKRGSRKQHYKTNVTMDPIKLKLHFEVHPQTFLYVSPNRREFYLDLQFLYPDH